MLILSKQKIYLRDSIKRINSTDGSVRSGKTFGTLLRWIDFVGTFPEKSEFMMCGKSQGSLRRNIIRPMQQLLGKQMKYKIGNNEIDLWGHKIYCFGAYDAGSEDIIRGLTSGGCYGDEITLWPEAFFTMMLSRLSLKGAQFHGSTNPDSPYHWFKTNFLDRAKELDLYNLHFVLEDNTTLDPAYVDALKKEYTGLWYKRFILGQWCAAEGAIYDIFDESKHTIDEEDLPKADSYYIGVDYGTGNPTCFILMGRNTTRQELKLKIWAEEEYYWDSKAMNRQKTDDEYAVDFFNFIGKRNVTGVFIDPSAASFILALKRKALELGKPLFLKEVDNSVVDGIRTQASLLSKGIYKICRKCKKTIKDYFGYSWDERAQKKGEDKPLKTDGTDHTKDSERYPLQSTYGKDIIDYAIYTKF